VLPFLIRRVLWAIGLFLATTFITYLIFFVIPANPASLACGKACTMQQVAVVKHNMGLDLPVWQQYLRWLRDLVFHGSLGRSFVSRQSVDQVIGSTAPVTASLVFGGAIFWLTLSIPLGIYSALHPRSIGDRAGMTFVLVGISAHPVWIGLILSFVFGYELRNFPIHTPIQGYCQAINPPFGSQCGGPVQWAYHLILPWTTFMILFAALYVRLVRANVMETLSEDYVRTARAKGASERRVIIRHVLRNSLLPVVTILGMDIGLALGGAIFTETIFGLPGLGARVISAYNNNDLPVIVGVVVFATVAVIVFNLIVDVLYAVIDPRIRLT
jgi:peptide/nickel transport system permease protein